MVGWAYTWPSLTHSNVDSRERMHCKSGVFNCKHTHIETSISNSVFFFSSFGCVRKSKDQSETLFVACDEFSWVKNGIYKNVWGKRQTRNDNHDKGIIALEFEINRDNRASLSYFGLIGIFSFSIPFRGRGKQDAIEEYQRITVCYQWNSIEVQTLSQV